MCVYHSCYVITYWYLLVRLCSDKLRLLRDCLKVKPISYRNTQRLLQLADFLRVSGDDSRAREASVLVLVAEAALQVLKAVLKICNIHVFSFYRHQTTLFVLRFARK